jgi:hypothetical protein
MEQSGGKCLQLPEKGVAQPCDGASEGAAAKHRQMLGVKFMA